MPLPAALAAFLASPAGQTALSVGLPLAAQGLQSAGGYARRGIFGLNENEQRQQQMGQLQQQLLGQLGQPYNYGEQDFAPIEQRELRRFREQTLPQLGNYYAGLGNLQSSEYQNALSGAGVDLGERLAALRAEGALQGQGLNQARQGALANYLGNQQNIAQRQHEFGRNSFNQTLGTGLQGLQSLANQQNLRRPLEGLQRGYGTATGQPWNVTQQRTEGIFPGLIGTVGQLGGAALGRR